MFMGATLAGVLELSGELAESCGGWPSPQPTASTIAMSTGLRACAEIGEHPATIMLEILRVPAGTGVFIAQGFFVRRHEFCSSDVLVIPLMR